MPRLLRLAPLLVLAVPHEAAAQAPAPPDTAAVSAVLNDFHDAASKADFQRYFGHFAPGGVFLGTDPAERWTVAQFQGYAKPYFDAGQGWTYVPAVRHVVISADGRTAWFDELLDNASYGTVRGSGTLVRRNGAWKIGLYDLTIPVPNDLAGAVVERIRDQAEAGAADASDAAGKVVEASYDALVRSDAAAFRALFWPGASITALAEDAPDAAEMMSLPVAAFAARVASGGERRTGTIVDVRVSGDVATAWVRSRRPGGRSTEVTDVATLLRQGGRWKIASLVLAPGR